MFLNSNSNSTLFHPRCGQELKTSVQTRGARVQNPRRFSGKMCSCVHMCVYKHMYADFIPVTHHDAVTLLTECCMFSDAGGGGVALEAALHQPTPRCACRPSSVFVEFCLQYMCRHITAQREIFCGGRTTDTQSQCFFDFYLCDNWK